MEEILLAALAARAADWPLRGRPDVGSAHADALPSSGIAFAAVAGPGDDDDDEDDDRPGGGGGNIDPDDDEGYDDDDDDDEEEPLQVSGHASASPWYGTIRRTAPFRGNMLFVRRSASF